MKRLALRGSAFCVFLACMVFLSFTSASAQSNTADVVGTVTDNTGAVIPGATVTITNTGTSISATAVSNGNGDYIFTLLQVGTYSLKVESKGFKVFSVPSVALSSGDRARVDAKLEVGDVTQTVEVSGTVAPALQTDTSNLGTLVTTQAVEDVPLNGRNLTKLIQLSAGVNQGGTNSIVSGNRPDDRRQTAAFSVNGQSDSINNNLIDGMDNNERIIGGNVARPSVDAIQEVNVSTNLYDASVGRTGGGVVDVVTKSGSNSFHGSGYEFFRNRVLNTNPGYSFPTGFNSSGVEQFSTVLAKPAFRQNQYGGSIGGPIKKNKTFFFADYEHLGYAIGNTFTINVPSACERGSALVAAQAAAEGVTAPSVACPDGTSPVNPGNFSDFASISAPSGGTSPCTKAAGPLTYGSVACPYVTIPTANITKLGLDYFAMFPLPNGPGQIGNYSSTPVKTQASTTLDGRVDQHLSDADTFYGRYSVNDVTTYTPNACPNVRIDPTATIANPGGLVVKTGGLLIVPGCGSSFPGAAKERQQSFSMSEVHIFNPNLVLNLKAGFLRSAIQSFDVDYGTNVSNALGFPCNSTPNIASSIGSCVNISPTASGLAPITLNVASPASGTSTDTPSYQGFGSSAFVPIFEFDTSFNYSGTLTWNKGSQSIKIGLALTRRRATIGQSNNPNGGGFGFTGIYTGNPVGDLLEGLAATNSRNYTLYQPGFRMWEPSTYIQDDWRARKWLTLNLGARYDIFTPFTEVHGRSTNYNSNLGLLVGADLPGIQQTGNTAGIKTQYTNFAPRFGFSASLPHDFVFRGGFGLSFFPINYQSPYNLKNAPANYQYTCAVQNRGSSANACTGTPYDNGAVTNFGTTSGNGSTIPNATTAAGHGGYLLSSGLPIPVENINQVFAPSSSVCTYNPAVGLATYATTCPAATDAYQSFGLGNIQAFNIGSEYLEQANLQMQKAFGANVLTVGGVLEMGRHAPKGLALNAIANPTEIIAGANTSPLGPKFPWLAKTTITQNTTTASDAYSALQATFVRRFNKGLTAQVNYTWAHARTFYGGACTPVNGFDAGGNAVNFPCFYDNPANPGNPDIVHWFNQGHSAANSGNDIADRIAWTVNYQLPFAKNAHGFTRGVLGGWASNLAGSWQTGLPFTVGQNATGINGIGGTGNPNQVCSGKLAHPTLTEWFDPSCFKSQAVGTFGNEEGSQLFGPSQKNLDFSLFKEFPLIKEGVRLQFRTEVFNLFNTPAFSTPSGTTVQYTGCNFSTTTCTGNKNSQTNGLTGAITSLNSTQANSRQIQFALKLIF